MAFSSDLPPHGTHLLADILEDGKLLHLTLNRPKQLNAMTDDLEDDLRKLLDFFEVTPSLWVCLVTGRSEPSQRIKAFCAGQDLKDWLRRSKENPSETQADRLFRNVYGFGSLSRRHSRKPIIAAVDGICLGGGLEMIVNCDLVIATERSSFGFPEVQRGVVAAQGGIPRLAALSGHAFASELLLLGQPVSAQKAHDRFRIVNRVVKDEKELMETAVDLARTLIANSPSAVQVTKLSLLEASHHLATPPSPSSHPSPSSPPSSVSSIASPFLSPSDRALIQPFGAGVERATMAAALRPEALALYKGGDFSEGLRAFGEKRRPRWTDAPPPPATGKAKL